MATIRKRKAKNGELSYIVQVKFTDKGSGKQIVRSVAWKPETPMTPKQEERAVAAFADNYEKQIKESVSGATVTENHNITFREFAAGWLEKVKRDYSLNYYVKCKDSIELSNKYIGGHKMRDITPAIIQSFYDKLDQLQKTTSRVVPKPDFRTVLESHGFNYMKLRYEYHVQACTLANALAGKPISKGWSAGLAEKTKIPFAKLFNETVITEPYAYETIHKTKRTVRTILSAAKKSRLIADNYASADYINFPKRPTTKISFMDDEQAKIFYKAVMDYPDIRYKTAMLLFLLTGFRRGEVAGLQWGDINFEDKTITISRSLTSVKGFGMVLKEPKTETSSRTISVADTLITALKEYRVWWLKRREELGDYMQENDFLFTQENGERLYPSTYTGWLNQVLKTAGLDHHSLHSIRHTNITMQIAAGVPIVTVAARAGHARPSTTSDIYAHFIKSSDKTAAAVIDKVFNPELPQPEIRELPMTNIPAQIVDGITVKYFPESQEEKPIDNIVADNDDGDSVADFKFVKSEMQRLGFDTYEEYDDYLAYMERKKQRRSQRNSDACM